MVRLVLDGSVVESGKELFGELEFAHVGVAALLLKAVEVAEQSYRSQRGGVARNCGCRLFGRSGARRPE